MTKRNQDFTMVEGDHKTPRFAITDNAGSPNTITGATPISWVLAATPGGTALVTKTLALGQIAIVDKDGTDDAIEVTLLPVDTQGLGEGNYHHEAQVTDASGNVSTIARGTVTILRDTV